MKKISYYLILIVIAGGALVSFWVYQRYFKEELPELLSFRVEKGSIQEIVRVRGEVVPEKDFDLEFPFSGIVESIFVQEGQQVNSGDPLMKLETTNFELEIKEPQARLAQAEANLSAQKAKLAELKRGTRQEDIDVQRVKVSNYEVALEDAKRNLVDKLQDAYTKADDAVSGKTNQMFTNPQTQNLQLKFSATDPSFESDVEKRRLQLEINVFPKWKASLDSLTPQSDLTAYNNEEKQYLDEVKIFLDKLFLIVNNPNTLYVESGTSREIPSSWKTGIAMARTNINIAINNLTAAKEKLKTAESNLALAEQQLTLKRAGTVDEQITVQEAQVKQAESDIKNNQAQIAVVQEKIRKSTLYAPSSSIITKVWFERREFFRPGQTAVSLSTSGHKIQADISELEIGKVREIDGNKVLIRLDAFPDLRLKGSIVSIEPKEVIKEGDKYYRTNVYVEPHGPEVRSGMNVDLIILVSSKDGVLKIPELTIFRKGDKEFVMVLEEGRQKEVEIETGISDGEDIEVIKGLSEGQTIVVSAD